MKISGPTKALKQYCKIYKIYRIPGVVRKTGNLFEEHRKEVIKGNVGNLAEALRMVRGMPPKITEQEIVSILDKGEILSKMALRAGDAEGLDKGEIVSTTKDIMKKLAEAKNIDEIWKVFGEIITKTGIGSGCGTYAINHAGEIQNRGRIGLEGSSRYHDWHLPKGEKAQIIYIYNVIAASYERTTGTNKTEYKNILKELMFWHIIGRDRWPEYGLNRKVLLRALDESGLNKLNSGFSVLFKSSKANDLIENIVRTVNEKLCLNDDLIDEYCGETFRKFIAAEKIVDKEEAEELETTYVSITNKVKNIAKEAIVRAFKDPERSRTSYDFWNKRGIKEMALRINESEDQSLKIFVQTLHNYCEALDDIEGDKQRLRMARDKGVPELINENFYYLVTDTNLRPIALVLANKHEESIKTGRIKRLFDGNLRREGSLIETLKEINDTLTLALELRTDQKRLKLNNEQFSKLLELSNIMNDESVDLNERLFQTAMILQKLFKKNGETINSSIMRVSLERPDEMELVTSTRIDPSTKKPITGKIFIKEKPAKISAWVAQIKKDVFAARGQVYVGGELMSDEKKKELETSYPELYGEMQRITSDKRNTFMTVPLISAGELLGVVNVDGAMLTEEDMNLLKSASVTLTLAVKNSLQAEKLKYAAEHDSLTNLFNRAFFDDMIKIHFTTAKEKNLPLSVVRIDLISFDSINNQANHYTGDHVLKSFAENLGKFNAALGSTEEDKEFLALTPNVTIARVGGDEFGLLLPSTSIAAAKKYMDKFDAYNQKNPVRFTLGPFKDQSRTIYFRAGINAFNDPNSGNLLYVVQTVETLQALADIAERNAQGGGERIRIAQP